MTAHLDKLGREVVHFRRARGGGDERHLLSRPDHDKHHRARVKWSPEKLPAAAASGAVVIKQIADQIDP